MINVHLMRSSLQSELCTCPGDNTNLSCFGQRTSSNYCTAPDGMNQAEDGTKIHTVFAGVTVEGMSEWWCLCTPNPPTALLDW